MHEDTVKDNIPDERVCKEEIEKAVKLNRIHFDSLHVVCLPISEGTEIDLKKEIKLCSDNAFPFEFEVNDRHKMEITAKGSVKGEKFFEVTMVGFLSFESDIKIKQEEKLNLILEKGREMLMPYMDEEIALIIKNPSSKYLKDLPNFTFNPEYFRIKSKKRHS